MKKIIFILIGIITGFANGFFGAGGGTILVPALEKFINIDTHKSHATSIAVILPLTIISLFMYSKNIKLDWNLVIFISIGGICGGYIGARFLNKFSGKILHKIFGIFIIIASLRMIL